MPVFDFNNSPEESQAPECTYEIFYSSNPEASADHPMLVLDNREGKSGEKREGNAKKKKILAAAAAAAAVIFCIVLAVGLHKWENKYGNSPCNLMMNPSAFDNKANHSTH